MNTRKRISISCFTFLMTLLATASCGLRDNPEPVPDTVPPNVTQMEEEKKEGTKAVAEFRYLETAKALEDMEANGVYTFNDEWLYIMVSPTVIWEGSDIYTHVDRIRISDGYQEENYITSSWNTSEYGVNAFLADKDGNCYLFWNPRYNAVREIYALEKYGEDGELLWRTEYSPETLLDMGRQLNKGTLTSDGRVLLYNSVRTGEKIFSFGKDGTLEEMYTFGLEMPEGIVAGANGKTYEYCLTNSKPLFRELGKEESYTCPIVPLEAYDGYEEDIFLRTGEGMWSYEPETGKTQLLWDWEDEYVQIRGDCMKQFFCDNDNGKFLLLCDEKDIMVSPHHTKPTLTFASISLEDAQNYPPRQTVTLSVFYRSHALDQMAKLYNRQGKKYKIEILEDTNEELLKKKLLQGDAADLIDISNLYAEDLAVLGAFENLAPYYEGSEKTNRNDILEPVRKACTIGETEIGVMPSFCLDTLLAKEAYCTPEEWTVWKFLEMSQTNKMFYEQTPMRIFDYCLGIRYGEHFVDAIKKESSFDEDEFRRMLEKCSTVETYRYTSEPGNRYIAFEDSDYLFTEAQITSPWDIVSDDDDNYSARLLGYPGWNGGEYKIHATAIFAISSASDMKEGAWDFLEYLLSAEYQDRINWGFPVRKDNFDDGLTDLYISPSRLELTYYLGEPAIPSEQDIALLREMVDSAIRDSWGGTTNPIWDIASYEASMYFAGDAALDDTVAKIQNRVQTYLNE